MLLSPGVQGMAIGVGIAAAVTCILYLVKWRKDHLTKPEARWGGLSNARSRMSQATAHETAQKRKAEGNRSISGPTGPPGHRESKEHISVARQKGKL